MQFKPVINALLTASLIGVLGTHAVNAQSKKTSKHAKHTTSKTVKTSKTKATKQTHRKKSIRLSDKTTVTIKDPNNNLSGHWELDYTKLNPVMNWELDGHQNPLIAQTYGANHNIVYYRTSNLGNHTQLVQKAIDAWNALGVISLQPAPNDTSVKAISITYDSTQLVPKVDGITYLNHDDNTSNTPTVFTQNDIHIEPSNDLHTETMQINTIEHEIGHALGFAHDESRYFNPYDNNPTAYTSSIMSTMADAPAGTYQIAAIPLGPREANNLRTHYNLK